MIVLCIVELAWYVLPFYKMYLLQHNTTKLILHNLFCQFSWSSHLRATIFDMHIARMLIFLEVFLTMNHFFCLTIFMDEKKLAGDIFHL